MSKNKNQEEELEETIRKHLESLINKFGGSGYPIGVTLSNGEKWIGTFRKVESHPAIKGDIAV